MKKKYLTTMEKNSLFVISLMIVELNAQRAFAIPFFFHLTKACFQSFFLNKITLGFCIFQPFSVISLLFLNVQRNHCMPWHPSGFQCLTDPVVRPLVGTANWSIFKVYQICWNFVSKTLFSLLIYLGSVIAIIFCCLSNIPNFQNQLVRMS